MKLLLRELGMRDYEQVWHDMQNFTDSRVDDTADEVWIVQHPPVYTLGKSGKPEHVIDAGVIPVVQTDRGGQVTYHGPGQLIAYVLLDINRLGLGVRELVTRLENTVIELLADYQISAVSRKDAPGVYVEDKKIAALGLRVRKGRCFHGLALNVEMDMEPFGRINPCGYPGLKVTQVADYVAGASFPEITEQLVFHLKKQMQYSELE